MHAQRAGMLGTRRTQPVKWTAEGAAKGIFPSIPQRSTGVTCEEYVCILLREGSGLAGFNQGGTAEFIRP